MSKVALPLPVLTEEQKSYIEIHWGEDIRRLTRDVFKDQGLDRRSIECKAVKQYLASMGKIILPVREQEAQTAASLTDEQQEYIRNNYKRSSPLEMARILFVQPTILTDSRECRTVLAFCRQMDPAYRKNEELVVGEYETPKSITALIPKINRYAINPRRDGKPLFDSEKLSAQDIKNLQSLLSYMQVPLFKVEADKYGKQGERDLFESTFVLFCWDKFDLLAEDVHREIAVAAETVKYTQIDRMAQRLDERVNSMLETPGEGSLKMAEVELLNSVREKANASMKNIASLLSSLVGNREKRLKEQRDSSASMYPLVQAWKNQDDRQRIIQMNERRQKAALKVEVERLSDMDSLKCELYGINKENIIR